MILCGLLAFGSFRVLMQQQNWFYVELMKRGFIQFEAQKVAEELQRKAKNIRRCIEKVEEIRALSDKMFEYALIYEKKEQVELTELFF